MNTKVKIPFYIHEERFKKLQGSFKENKLLPSWMNNIRGFLASKVALLNNNSSGNRGVRYVINIDLKKYP